MPSTPIRQQVSTNLQTALLNIDGTSSYFNDVDTRVYLYNKNLTTINDFPSIILIEGQERKTVKINRFNSTLQFAIIGLVKEGDNGEKSSSISEMLHDIEKAVMADITLSGVSIDINILGNQYFQDEKSDRVGVIVELEVIYQTSLTDPSSVS